MRGTAVHSSVGGMESLKAMINSSLISGKRTPRFLVKLERMSGMCHGLRMTSEPNVQSIDICWKKISAIHFDSMSKKRTSMTAASKLSFSSGALRSSSMSLGPVTMTCQRKSSGILNARPLYYAVIVRQYHTLSWNNEYALYLLVTF